MIALTTVLRRHPGVRFRVLNDEAVVLHQGSAEVMVLDAVATRILSLADGVSPISRWADVLFREYEVPREVLERDVLDFAAELEREGLLERVTPDLATNAVNAVNAANAVNTAAEPVGSPAQEDRQ